MMRCSQYEACASVCCATLLLNSSAPLVCRRDRVTREVGLGPSGKGSGEEGILSGVVPVYLYCPASNVSVSLGV